MTLMFYNSYPMLVMLHIKSWWFWEIRGMDDRVNYYATSSDAKLTVQIPG